MEPLTTAAKAFRRIYQVSLSEARYLLHDQLIAPWGVAPDGWELAQKLRRFVAQYAPEQQQELIAGLELRHQPGRQYLALESVLGYENRLRPSTEDLAAAAIVCAMFDYFDARSGADSVIESVRSCICGAQ